jgi:hypothetical protein
VEHSTAHSKSATVVNGASPDDKNRTTREGALAPLALVYAGRDEDGGRDISRVATPLACLSTNHVDAHSESLGDLQQKRARMIVAEGFISKLTCLGCPTMFITGMFAACNLSTISLGGTPMNKVRYVWNRIVRGKRANQ